MSFSGPSRTSLKTSTGKRLVEGLLSSGNRVAWIGLAAALATLGFTLLFQALAQRQLHVGLPMAQASSRLHSSLLRSLANLRGWIAYQDPSAREARSRTWIDIEAAIETLEEAANRGRDPEVADWVAELDDLLRHLKVDQWIAEEMSSAPGNEPASAFYQERLEPLHRNMIEGMAALSALPDDAAAYRVAGPGSLLRFRAILLELDSAVRALLQEHTVAAKVRLDQRASQAEAVTYLVQSAAAAPRPPPGRVDDSIELLESVVKDASAYQDLIAPIVEMCMGPSADRARHLFNTRIKPRLDRALELARDLSERQQEYSKRAGRALFLWSFVVLALSLLMGGLSVGSLVVSARLQIRVESALSKARQLGQYVIEARIGGGAMGDVYQARHALLRRPCAVKLLKPAQLQDVRAQERFQREVRLTSSLTHPNTIAIYDYGKTPDGIFYYVMELLHGATLDVLIDMAGPVEPRRVVHILKQLCASLAEAHETGLLHRDVKPSNIMIAKLGAASDVVKVLDFGLVAEVEAEGVRSKEVVGTPMFLAPEAIGGAPSAQSDLYAVGAVAYQLLTASPVFPYERVEDVLQAHLQARPEAPSQRLGRSLSEPLELLVLGCLAKDPADRPENARVLMRLLDEVDLAPWTFQEAEVWWDNYGEALLAESRARGLSASTQVRRSVIEVASHGKDGM